MAARSTTAEKGAPRQRVIADVLAQYGELTRQALLAYLPSGDPQRYLYELIGDYPSRGGKMMRASLCLATANVFGAAPEDALASAVAIEMSRRPLK